MAGNLLAGPEYGKHNENIMDQRGNLPTNS